MPEGPSPEAEPAAAPPPDPRAPATLAARGLLAAVALGLLALGVVLLAGRGFELTLLGAAGFASRAALAAVLLAAAWRPEALARALRAPRLATPAGLVALALAAAALYVVFGLGTTVETARLVEGLQAGQSQEQVLGDIDRTELLASLTLNLLVFTVPAVAWAAGAEGQGGKRLGAWLRLHSKGARWSLVWAGVSVLLIFWFLIAAGLLSRALGAGEVENQRAEAIARALDVPTALLVAAMTGVGEEVFFRGLLLRKLGNAPQAVLFGLAHLNYLQVLEVAVTAALGYMFGRTVLRTGNLWGPIVGHAAFNATSLLLILARGAGALG